MLPYLLHQFFGDLEMENRRRDDVQRVAGRGGFFEGIENMQLVLFRNGTRTSHIVIVDAGHLDQAGGVEFRIDPVHDAGPATPCRERRL